MGFDLAEIPAHIHEHKWRRARLGPWIDFDFLLDHQPMKLSKALGLQRQCREVARKPLRIEQLLQFLGRELGDSRAAERDRRQIVGEIERTDVSAHGRRARVGCVERGRDRRNVERES